MIACRVVVLLDTMVVSVTGLLRAFTSFYTLKLSWQKMEGRLLDSVYKTFSLVLACKETIFEGTRHRVLYRSANRWVFITLFGGFCSYVRCKTFAK
jgi:hypothetical protein